ncbi:MAG: phosphate acyltransferase PlsX [FCB group bacterium]|nr:phosphate acyltransferase PlsX [FCB group bacterium]
MRIALDAMGSDRAPLPEVEGAVKAASAGDFEVVLVGDEARLKAALSAYPKCPRISIVHASEAIAMNDPPAVIRRKRDSSLAVALRLHKQGEVDAVVTAGNTGAVVVGARVMLGFIEGVARAAISPILPTAKAPVVILDQGANVDCTARHLCEFAEMGTVYSRNVLGAENPRVGLLNIGQETAKGNDLAKTVHHNLTAAKNINFIGNIEPKAMFEGNADVVICDGFVGNMVLKTSEAAAWLMSNLMKRELKSTWTSRIGALLGRGAFKRLKKTVDANHHPGAPLLGVNGNVVILHGAVSGKGVANGIRGAVQAVEKEVNAHIREGVAELRQVEVLFTNTKRESYG